MVALAEQEAKEGNQHCVCFLRVAEADHTASSLLQMTLLNGRKAVLLPDDQSRRPDSTTSWA
jgi:hypothetical protein